MATPSNTTGTAPSGSVSTGSPRQKPVTSSGLRRLTSSEIDWLKREGREFQEQYEEIRKAVLRGRDDEPDRWTRLQRRS